MEHCLCRPWLRAGSRWGTRARANTMGCQASGLLKTDRQIGTAAGCGQQPAPGTGCADFTPDVVLFRRNMSGSWSPGFCQRGDRGLGAGCAARDRPASGAVVILDAPRGQHPCKKRPMFLARRFVAGGALDCAAEDRRNMSGQLEHRGAMRRLSQGLSPQVRLSPARHLPLSTPTHRVLPCQVSVRTKPHAFLPFTNQLMGKKSQGIRQQTHCC